MRSIFSAIRAVGCCAALATLLPAQQLTAHPQETVQNSGHNLAPFGGLISGNAAECRTHILVPKNELPSNVALLIGIEIQANNTAAVTYGQLELGVGPFVGTALSANFAANITTPLTPMLPAGPITINWTSNAWTPLPTNGFYVHDGQSDMLIEIRKVVQGSPGSFPLLGSAKSSSPPRLDRPLMAYTYGSAGTGAASAASANVFADQILYRLVWQTQPTLRHRQNQGLAPNQYALGSTVELTMAGQPGQLWVLAAGTGFLPQAVPFPGIIGALRIAGPVIFASGVLGAGGEAVQPVVLPTTPSLIGFYLVYQGAVVDPGSGVIVLTNGTDHFVNA